MITISSSSTNTGKTGQSEALIQKQCWAWLGHQTVRVVVGSRFWDRPLQDYAYMVPNGTQLGGSHRGRAAYMSSLKAQGFRVGVSDIVIAYPNHDCGAHAQGADIPPGGYHGAYIELKREPEAYGGPRALAARKSAIRPDQREWLEKMAEVGYFAAIAWGLEDFKRMVRLFLRGESPPPLDWDNRK